MRDDEDHIRQFMPVLRRIVILVAVLTAIPVAMWTITAFIRTYVGPPKTPTFQRMADAGPAGGASSASAAAPGDNATTGSTQTSPAPIVEAKATATDADANAPMSDANAAAPAGGMANAASPNAAPSDPAFPNVTAPNTPAPAAMGQTAAATNDAAPANAASPGTAPAAAGTADLAAPTPPAYAAPNDAPDGGVQVAAQQPAPTNWPTSQPPAVESLPPDEPIAGLVPLPRKRPKTFELAQGPIPLPMPRPEAAGAGAQQAPATPFDWLQHIFRAASDGSGSAPPASGDNGYTDTPH
jgi:hypothetical protein